MAAAAEYETSRPCPECGRVVNLSNVKPGNKTFCRNSEAHPGRRVGIRRREIKPEPSAVPAAAAAAAWQDEAPAASWQAALGKELPDAARCDGTCLCSSPPLRYTGDHTGAACPECGPECWDVTPGAFDRGQAHAQATAPALKAGTPGGPSRAEVDELDKARAVALDAVDGIREQLATIPRGDDQRAAAIAATVTLDKLAGRYKAAAWLADLDLIDQAADEMTDELAGLLDHAAAIAQRSRRPGRRGGWLRGMVAGDGVYEYVPGDDQDQDDEDGPAELSAAPPAVVPGYLAPDPQWRQQASSVERAYWDQRGAPTLAPGYRPAPPPQRPPRPARPAPERPGLRQIAGAAMGRRDDDSVPARHLYGRPA